MTMVANERENSILVTARPDKMAIIIQVIEAVDVPLDRDPSLSSAMSRMKTYRLTGVDPEPVLRTLQQVGDLAPSTRLEIDAKNKAIIAYASAADHEMIQGIIDKLSGSERSFKVMKLRKLPADQVAGSIMFMMGIDPKKKKERSNPWMWDRPERESSNDGQNQFRVDADVEHNWLMLYANETEMNEVNNLLVQLGEIPPADGSGSRHRMIETGSPEETQALLERLKKEWPLIAPNHPLVTPQQIPVERPKPTPTPSEPQQKETQPAPAQPKETPKPIASPDTKTTAIPSNNVFRFVGTGADAAADAPAPQGGVAGGASPANAAPDPGKQKANEPIAAQGSPVKILVGPDGRLLISCDDPRALDLLEEFLDQLAPANRDYNVFRLKYASAYGVALNLQDYFKEEKKEESRWRPWWDTGSDDKDDKEQRLSTRRKLKFIPDYESNTILVDGATASQLHTIQDLIDLYDQPPPSDSQSVRKTEIIQLKYARAKTVAEAVKEVYRDLLSANDKALSGPGQAPRDGQRGFVLSFGDSGRSEKGEQRSPKFKGELSIGVDETSNTLAVSSPKYLFEQVRKMIEDLDQAAAPSQTVRVVQVGPGVSASQLQEVLGGLLNQDDAKKNAAATRSRQPNAPYGNQQQQRSNRRGTGGQTRTNTQGR